METATPTIGMMISGEVQSDGQVKLAILKTILI